MVNERRRINSLDYAMYEFFNEMGKTDLAKDLLEGVIQYHFDNNYYGDNEFVKAYLEWFTQEYLDRIVEDNFMELVKYKDLEERWNFDKEKEE